jgi:hypothetical protein
MELKISAAVKKETQSAGPVALERTTKRCAFTPPAPAAAAPLRTRMTIAPAAISGEDHGRYS